MRKSYNKLILLLVLLAPAVIYGQKIKTADLESLSKSYAVKSLSHDLKDFLSLPNNSLIKTHVEANLNWLKASFESRGFSTRELPTSGNPAFFAEKKFSGASKTVIFYMHFDGQPVDPTKWYQKDPYRPVIKKQNGEGDWEIIPWANAKNDFDDDWRVFARSASDDKSPIIMFLTALDIMTDRGQNPSFNIKVILDSEEEQGSPNLPEAVRNYTDVLASDCMVILDGPLHGSGLPTLIFGTRGVVGFELTVYGPRAPQHSGHFGNYAPNPALRLSQLLGSMKDEHGKVIIPGFYDGIVLSKETKEILAAVPDDVEKLMNRAGIGETDRVGPNYQEAMQYPSLNIRGFSSGWVGAEARTIVPSTAIATLDIRLVPETDGRRLIRLVRNWVEEKGYHILLGRGPTEEERRKYGKIIRMDYNEETFWDAFYTPMESETGKWLYNTLKEAHGSEVVRIRLAGGSVPIALFIQELNIPAVLVPPVNPDNNQHSPNENLRLGHYKNGIKSALAILNSKMY